MILFLLIIPSLLCHSQLPFSVIPNYPPSVIPNLIGNPGEKGKNAINNQSLARLISLSIIDVYTAISWIPDKPLAFRYDKKIILDFLMYSFLFYLYPLFVILVLFPVPTTLPWIPNQVGNDRKRRVWKYENPINLNFEFV